MKRVLLLMALGLSIVLTQSLTADAGFLAERKAIREQVQYEKDCKKDIQELFANQDKYAKAYDMDKLQSLYDKNFVDNDGYNKEVYFSLVQDTWNTYPDITYTTKIKNIKLNGDYATVETEETANATSDDLDRHIIGELNSKSNCIYHLQKFANKWAITAEQVTDEISTLKYGDARYINIDLESPKMVGAGQSYTATLKVDIPKGEIVVGSINQEKIVNPAVKPEEHFMKVKEDGTLSRIFTSNTDNINEYNVASVAFTKNDDTRIYMNGIAFIMARVNVVPINNFAKVDRKTEDKK